MRRPNSAAREFVEARQTRFRCRLLGCRYREHERFDDHEGGRVTGEESRRAAAALQRRAHGAFESARQCVGDEDDGHVKTLGLVQEHTNVRLEPAVGEDDDRVVRCQHQELVGEGRPSVDECAARLPDPLRDELSVLGQMS